MSKLRNKLQEAAELKAKAVYEKDAESVQAYQAIHKLAMTAAENIAKMMREMGEHYTENSKYLIAMNRAIEYDKNGFDAEIQLMNKMYNCPTTDMLPPTPERLKDYIRILTEEVEELEKLIPASENFWELYNYDKETRNQHSAEYNAETDKRLDSLQVQILVGLVDNCCDVSVFAASELARCSISISPPMNLVMASNFTKLGEDGKPIWKDGKFQKGPNYLKPEPALEEMIRNSLKMKAEEEHARIRTRNIWHRGHG